MPIAGPPERPSLPKAQLVLAQRGRTPVGGEVGGGVFWYWGWAAPAKKNEASIFFPPAKIEGARGHNECRNAT